VNRSYSCYTEETITLLARLIHAARLERKLSAQEVAERAYPEACFNASKKEIWNVRLVQCLKLQLL